MASFGQRRTLALLDLATAFLTVNWGVYIWSVSVNRVVEAALGYYMTPLVSVAFGVIVIHERMRRMHWVPVLLASIAVIPLTFHFVSLPCLALPCPVSCISYL